MSIIQRLLETQSLGTADRTQVIGASEAAAVLGLSPWATPTEVWMSKRLGLAEESGTTKAHKRGHRLERAVLEEMAEQMGADCEPGNAIDEPFIGREDTPWLGAHFDGALTVRDSGEEWIAECKTARDSAQWGDEGLAQLPQHILVQATVQSLIADLPVAVGCYLPFKDDWKVYRLPRDIGLEADVLTMLENWYVTHVVQGVQPPMDGSAKFAKHLAQKYGPTLEGMRDATADEEALVRELVAAKAAAKVAESEADRLGNVLRDIIGTSEGIRCGAGKVTWTWQRGAERIDAKALRLAYPDIAEQFSVRGDDARVLRVKGGK